MNEFVIEKKASSFRKLNGFDNNDPIRLKSLLQKLNVITLFKPLSNNFSGMAIKAKVTENEAVRFVLINSNQILGKQHFTICHELYHLFIQEKFDAQLCNTGLFKKDDINEYYADVFASYLILPTEGILENIPNEELEQKKITLKTILFLENFYSCSRAALLYRLKGLRLIKANDYDFYKINIKKGAIENGYETSIYESANANLIIGDYGIIARTLFENEKISESHYYTLLTDLGIDTNKINNVVDED